VTDQTMAVRLVRAKRKIKTARIPYRVRQDRELPGRLHPVLAVVYLIYTAGLTSPAEPGLCPEAIRRARGGRAAGAAAADRVPPPLGSTPGTPQVYKGSVTARRGPLQNRLARHPERQGSCDPSQPSAQFQAQGRV